MRHNVFQSSWIASLLSLAITVPHGALLATQAGATQAQTAAAAKQATAAEPEPPPGTNADTGWPRTIALKTGTATWYQPQVESWVAQKDIVAWSAVAYMPTGAKEPAFGTIKIEGPTAVSVDDRVVRLDLRISEYNFKTLSRDQVAALVADVEARPQNERVMDLDRLLAYVEDSSLQVNVKNVEGIKADPPKIFSAPAPAVLVNIDGEPIWSPIEGLDLRYVVNTNWDIFEHTPSKAIYMRYNTSWLQASAVTGPWSAIKGKLPESFSKLPADANWSEVRTAVPGRSISGRSVPKVFVSMEPAELIMLTGNPSYLKVDGAQTLLWVENTEADLFRMGQTGEFYFLVAGRWFKAASLEGPWTFATPTLPTDFKLIPVEHPRSRVLASIPGTPQAMEGVLLASIPRTARVNKKDVTAPEVTYQGEPMFRPVEGATGVEQAVNTDKDIVKHGDVYYMCFQGVWFMSRAATGPWEVAETIPAAIYTIPASSPVHHVTYVTVEDDNDNDEWVTFAYVAGYTGMMVAWGCAVWGTGWYYPPYGYGGFYGGYYPYPHTYGMGAWYNPHTGAYGRGYAAYGPYGGVGMAASYNPRTGTYARGAAAYGPYQSRAAGQAYNPRTGTYAQTRQGSNVYGNWGTSSVQRGDNWAQTAHRTNYQTGRTTAGMRTSEGGGAITTENRFGTNTTVGRTQGGDVYAGRDGNVYRRTDGGGWEQHNGAGGGWSDVSRPENLPSREGGGATTRPATTQAGQLDRDSAARARGTDRATSRSTWQGSGASRAGAGSYGGGRARAGGGGGARRR